MAGDPTKTTDYLGDPIPAGYRQWACPVCTAMCNFEAMGQCHRMPNCGFDLEQPESNGGAFAFIVKEVPHAD